MMSLREYRSGAAHLADFLPWAALVKTGVVLNKEAAFSARRGSGDQIWIRRRRQNRSPQPRGSTMRCVVDRKTSSIRPASGSSTGS